MLTKYFWLLVCASLGFVEAGFGQTVLKVGDPLPMADHQIVDTSERTISLRQTAGRNGLIVIFSSNTCPWVSKWDDRMIELSNFASSNGFGMIALNSNERIRDRGESLEDMDRRAQKQNYNYTYAIDTGHILADAFGAQYTPEVFIFNSDKQLVYHGAIDDNPDSSSNVSNTYVMNVLNAILKGNSISVRNSRLIGCSIKRSE